MKLSAPVAPPRLGEAHTCHRRFSLQLPTSQPQPLVLSHRDKIMDAARSGGAQTSSEREVVACCCQTVHTLAAVKPTSYQALLLLLDPTCSRLGHHGCTHRPHPRHDLAEHQLHPGPVLSRESCLPRCFPPSDGSRDLRGKQLESLGQAVTNTGRRRRKLGWLSYYKGHLVQVKCCLSSRKSFPVFGE